MLSKQEAVIEAVLFAFGGPAPLAIIAEASGLEEGSAKELVTGLAAKYAEENRGMIIIEVDGAYQMCTNPEYYENISSSERIARRKPLSQAALEALAIVAYKQPVTKGDIEDIRGVDTGHAVNKLLECGLVAEKGRRNTPGRPIEFVTTQLFLTHFGLTNLQELPTLNNDIDLLRRQVLEEISHPQGNL